MADTSARPSHAPDFDDDATWTPWTPEQATTHLQGIKASDGRSIRWAVAGGWAIDLHLGRQTRDHDDLEIVVLNDDVQAVLDAFANTHWQWKVPVGSQLHPLNSPAYTESHQTWLWSKTSDAFVLDVFREMHDGAIWICRRDPTMTKPWPAVVRMSASSVPYLAPEIVLLFKAKHARSKDLADLTTVLPSLNGTQRDWLRAAIEQVHPNHNWLRRI
jgi:hypothetical protein